tara:strand:- start:7193 stop:7531 length:339 start_codon:yes stop_codon:yes gene_type:complete
MAKTKKNQFEKNLTLGHTAIRNKNAKELTLNVEDSSTEFLRVKYAERRSLERKMQSLNNIHPSSTTTLDVTFEGFDADVWVRSMSETKYKLAILNQKIALDEETHKQYFGNE